jgi:hypothetical protein
MIISAFITAFLLNACNALYSKDDYVRDFRNFVIEVKTNCNSYTQKDWAMADKKYMKFSDELYTRFRGELTEQDQFMIGRLKGVYNALRLKEEAKWMLYKTNDMINQAKGFIEGSVEGLK